jgi:murein DD-endopeptidase
VAIAFAAVPQSRTKPKRPSARASSNTQSGQHANAASGKKKHQPPPQKPPPDFPAAPFPFTLGGSLTEAAQDNPVVSIATKYLGIPYLWGGASPKTGFDCSGLVMYVFAQLGVELTHYAAAQYRTPDGVWVAPNQLQSGDLVFFTGSDGTRKAPGHVGIYVGDGYLIDAPQTGTDVRIDNLDEPKLADQYVGARRIVTPLVTRHLFRVSSHGVRSPGILARAFPQESGLAAAGESTPGIAAVAFRSASRGFPLWVGGPLGGLLILLLAGAVVFRRYRSAPDATSSKPSD